MAMAKVARAREAADDALAELHDVIREMLANPRHGDLTAIARRTGYAPQHVDRIRRGLTSGKAPADSGDR